MIKLENMTPEVYYRQSRDFQFIGRLYDIVLNSIKTNSDLIDNLPLNNNLDSNLVDLLVITLGFKAKHNYNLKQLTALGNAFSLMLREKGTKKSIQTAIGLLLNAEGIIDDLEDLDDYIYVDLENYNVDIFVSKNLSSFSLLTDILEYILPAGMTYKINKGLKRTITSWTEIGIEDYVTIYKSNSIKQTIAKESDFRTIKNYLDDTADPEDNISFIRNANPDENKVFNGLFINSTVIKNVNLNNQEGD